MKPRTNSNFSVDSRLSFRRCPLLLLGLLLLCHGLARSATWERTGPEVVVVQFDGGCKEVVHGIPVEGRIDLFQYILRSGESAAWSGNCVNGYIDGEGTIRIVSGGDRTENTGTATAGRKIGMWRVRGANSLGWARYSADPRKRMLAHGAPPEHEVKEADKEVKNWQAGAAAARTPSSPTDAFRRAFDHYVSRQYVEAEQLFFMGLRTLPSDPNAHFYLAETQLALGQRAESKASFERALQLGLQESSKTRAIQMSLMLSRPAASN